MAVASENLVHEISTSTGTGNVTLASRNGRQSFNDAFGTGGTDVFFYFISHQGAAEWEVGSGHLSTSTTLVRDTVLASSNGGSAVNFSAGTKDVTSDYAFDAVARVEGTPANNQIAVWTADGIIEGSSLFTYSIDGSGYPYVDMKSQTMGKGAYFLLTQPAGNGADNDYLGGWYAMAKTTTGAEVQAGWLDFSLITATNGADTSQGTFGWRHNGAVKLLLLTENTVAPSVNDSIGLGTSLLGWSDLFLASGAVINFNAGDVTITHSANALSFSGGSYGFYSSIGPANAPIISSNSFDTGSACVLSLIGNRATPANGDNVYISFYLENSVGASTQAGQIRSYWESYTSAAEQGAFQFSVNATGSLTTKMRLNETTLRPEANDGLALGSSSIGWSDLFLASGAVINFNASNVVLTHSTGVLNVSTGALQQGGTPVKVAGKETIWVPAAALTNPSSTATYQIVTLGTGGAIPVWTVDPATAEHLYFNFGMPKSWDEGTVTFQVFWANEAGGSGNVVWRLELGAFGDDDGITNTFGVQSVTDAALVADDLAISAVSSAITIGGTPAEGDLVRAVFFRDATSGSDTYASDTHVIGVRIIYTSNAANDD